jgi:tetratricopeptide (TPR) repeat protein
VNDAEFSPDGKRVATASYDGTAQIWDAQTGQPLTQPLRHGAEVLQCVFSPDGARVLTSSLDNTARVWDGQTGAPLTRPLVHKGEVFSAQFSPDGKDVVTASYDKTARVWDARTGEALTPPLPHPAWVRFARFSPDGKRIVTTLDNGYPWLSAAQFSPDGKHILAASSAVRLWDARSGLPLTEFLEDAPKGPSPEARPHVSSNPAFNEGVCVWDVGFVPSKSPDWLLPVAEALSGLRLNKQGALEQTDLDRAKTIAQIRRKLQDRPDEEDGVQWGRWLLSDPLARTISPCSTIIVSSAIEQLIKEHTMESLNQAEDLAFGNTQLVQRISQIQGDVVLRSNLRSNAFAYGRAGHWKEAAADFSKLAEMEPDDTNYDALASLLVQTGDVENYRSQCARILARFGETEDPVLAQSMAVDCLIAPVGGIDLNAAAKLAGTAVSKGKENRFYPWFAFAKGLAEYRLGHFTNAVDWMQKPVADGSGNTSPELMAQAWVVLAMAQYQSGQRDAAHAALAKGVGFIEMLPKLDSGDLGRNWPDVLVAHALLKEAKELIDVPKEPVK